MRWSILGVLVGLLAGCSGASPGPAWTEVPLAGGPASVALGDLIRCGGRWYASGALRHPAPDPDLAAGEPAVATEPALWVSADGRDWRPAPLAPVSYYGARQVLGSLACRDGDAGGGGADVNGGAGGGNGGAAGGVDRGAGGSVAALGAKAGGAHGNPRVSSWRPDGRSGLAEVDAPVEQYGGPRAVTANTIAGGSGGWLIAGNRVGVDGGPTAAVWLSADAARFAEHADAAGLASTADTVRTARGAVATPGGWLVWGDTRRVSSLVREPALWASADGLTWRAEPAAPVPPGEDASVSAVGVDRDRVLAMGTLGGVPHAWYRVAGTWADAGAIPAATGAGATVARVGQVALTPVDAYAVVDDGRRWSLWRSADLHGWREVPVPVRPPSGADNRLRVAVSDDLLVVAGSDAGGAHLWVAPRPR